MEAIVIGGKNISRELIRQLSTQLGETSISLVNALEVLVTQPVKDVFDSFPLNNFIPDPVEYLRNYSGDESSWIPRHGYFCAHLHTQSCVVHAAMAKIRKGYQDWHIVRFYRKCFMQLKVFVNFRF